MPVFNAEKYIERTIDSILDQTFQNFILIIVNDGSTDNTKQIIEKYDNSNIQIFNKEHSGIIDSFNFALSHINTEYAARIDADDIYRSYKFEKQIKFLENNPIIAIVGTQANYMSSSGKISKMRITVPLDHNSIMQNLFTYKRAIIQSTIVIRTNVLLELKGYRSNIYPEDFDLFFRVGEKYKIANLKDSLANIRIHSSYSHKNLQKLLLGYETLLDHYLPNNKTKKQTKQLSKSLLLSLYFNRKGLNQYLNRSKILSLLFILLSGIMSPNRLFKTIIKKFN